MSNIFIRISQINPMRLVYRDKIFFDSLTLGGQCALIYVYIFNCFHVVSVERIDFIHSITKLHRLFLIERSR